MEGESKDEIAVPQINDAQAEQPDEASYVDRSLQRLAQTALYTGIVAWLLTFTSRIAWLNLPAAFATVVAFHWFSQQLRLRGTVVQSVRPQRARVRFSRAGSSASGSAPRDDSAGQAPRGNEPMSPASAVRADQRWREAVGSPVLESAWETLCGSIVQEFVYDAWYSQVTPDREFPREVRRMLNHAFGALAVASQALDLRALLLGDIAESVVEHLQLYRDTKESILQGMGEQAWQAMAPPARERALQAELRSEGSLHPALYPSSAASTFDPYRGHYKVLRKISEGLVSCLMEKGDHSRPAARALCRELVATCVLRSIIACFSPYQANKLLLRLLQERGDRRGVPEEEFLTTSQSLQRNPLQTHWEFEERLRKSAVLEDVAAESTRAERRVARERSASRSLHAKPSVETDPATEGFQEGKAATSVPLTASPVGQQGYVQEVQRLRPGFQPPSLLRTISATSLGQERNHSDSDGWEDVGGGPSSNSAPASTSASPLPLPIAAAGSCAGKAWPEPGQVTRAVANPEEARWISGCASEEVGGGGLPSTSGSAQLLADAARDQRGGASAGSSALGQARQGFQGRPRAKVGAADLNTDGGRDVVMYKIRVADTRGEWTVSRRFRHFEALHRSLRDIPACGLKLPNKRIFSHGQTVEFVEERRQALDSYLAQILADSRLAGRQEVWEFCSAPSEVYGAEDANFLRAVGANLRDAHSTMRRAVGGVADGLDSRRRRLVSSRSSDSDSKLSSRLAKEPTRQGPDGLSSSLAYRGGVYTSDDSASVRRGTVTVAEPDWDSERLKVVRISNPAELLSGAGALIAAGARKVSAVRSALHGSQEAEEAKEVPLHSMTTGSAMLPPLGKPNTVVFGRTPAEAPAAPMPMRVVGPTPDSAAGRANAGREEGPYNEGEVLQYTAPTISQRPTPFQSQTTTPNITPATLTPASSRATTPPGSGHATPAATPTAASMHLGGSGGSWEQLRRVDLPTQRSTRFRQALQESRSSRLGGTITESPAEGDAVDHSPQPEPPAVLPISSVGQQPSAPKPTATQSIPPATSSVNGVEVEVCSPGHITIALASPAGEQPGAHLVLEASKADVGLQTGPSLDPGLRPSTSSVSFYGEEGRSEGSDGWEEETTGISAPLYEFVDTLFELHRRGFFRRQILGLARQLLSLVAGGAIDDWLAQQLRTLRQEHTLARIILSLQASLWPGGTWFQNLADPPPARVPMTEDRYLVTDGPAPLDNEEIREAVWELLSSKAPPSLVRVIGKQAYIGGMTDLFSMMQSTTFMHQLGYSVLRIVLVSLFPRLDRTFNEVEQGLGEIPGTGDGGMGEGEGQQARAGKDNDALRRIPSAPSLRQRTSRMKS